MSAKERLPSQEIMTDLASALAGRFVVRNDLQARQLKDGSYRCLKKPLLLQHLKAHLAGKITLGTYLLDEESRGKFLVLDADSDPDWRRLRALSIWLAEQGSDTYLEPSRRGGHLWFFFEAPLPGEEIRDFGQGILAFFGIEKIEMYPKQSQLSAGPGSLIRLPFGVHRKAGRRYGFHLPNGDPLAATLKQQIHVLQSAQTIQKDIFERFCSHTKERTAKSRFPKSQPAHQTNKPVDIDAAVSERIKASISVRAFVEKYVELTAAGHGLCPFHDDQVESFSVNEEDNYWYCFACDKGGSIIDFWMQWRNYNFKLALKELADLLL